jgi:hypothetical protein
MNHSGALNPNPTPLHLSRLPLWITGGAALVALTLSGCSSNQHADSSRMPNPELQRVAELPPPAPSESAPPTSTTTIYRPRTQEEIDRLYAMPAPAPIVTTTHTRTPYVSDGAVVADPAWDIPITRDWHHIVVHHSASAVGSASIFDKAHRERGWDGLGYHFVIGNGSASGDGEVEVGYRWTKQMQGAHAGNIEYNQHGIGICLVGDFEHGGTPSPAQMASLRRLVRFLQVKTGISTSEVIGHGNVPGKSTQCPGRSLDVGSFRESLGGGAIGVPIQYTAHTAATPTHVAHRAVASSGGGASLP